MAADIVEAYPVWKRRMVSTVAELWAALDDGYVVVLPGPSGVIVVARLDQNLWHVAGQSAGVTVASHLVNRQEDVSTWIKTLYPRIQ